MKRARVTLPHEHGGYLTVLGAILVALPLSPAPLPALVAALCIVAAFFARCPLEKLALGGAPASWDRAWLTALVALMLAGATWAALARGLRALLALMLGAGILAASYAARRQRGHRAYAFELLGMAALGAGAGAIMLAGGSALRSATLAAVVLGAHAAVAVPLVRSELRPAERARRKRADGVALATLGAAAGVTLWLGAPLLLLALAPRAIHLALRQRRPPTTMRPAWVGLRETASLAATAGLVVGAFLWR